MTTCSSQLISSLHSLLCSTPPSTPVKKAWLDGEGKEDGLTVTCCRGVLTTEGGDQRSLVCDTVDTGGCLRSDDDVSGCPLQAHINICPLLVQMELCHFIHVCTGYFDQMT